MTKHAPGPWEAILYPSGIWSVETDKCVVADRVTEGSDARLIAAAPELLEVVREFQRIDATLPPESRPGVFMSVRVRARAAIAKSEGES